jgi:hypothetical protein
MFRRICSEMVCVDWGLMLLLEMDGRYTAGMRAKGFPHIVLDVCGWWTKGVCSIGIGGRCM